MIEECLDITKLVQNFLIVYKAQMALYSVKGSKDLWRYSAEILIFVMTWNPFFFFLIEFNPLT